MAYFHCFGLCPECFAFLEISSSGASCESCELQRGASLELHTPEEVDIFYTSLWADFHPGVKPPSWFVTREAALVGRKRAVRALLDKLSEGQKLLEEARSESNNEEKPPEEDAPEEDAKSSMDQTVCHACSGTGKDRWGESMCEVCEGTGKGCLHTEGFWEVHGVKYCRICNAKLGDGDAI